MELMAIYKHIALLKFEEKPDYGLIKDLLTRMLRQDIRKEQNKPALSSVIKP
jgi:hypothetical protein